MAKPREFGINKADRDVTDFSEPKQRSAKVGVRIFERPPSDKEVGEGEHVFAFYGGVRRMFVKVKGVVVSTTLT